MEAQTFELKTPYLKTGRSHNILAQTDLINVAIKYYYEGGENTLHTHPRRPRFCRVRWRSDFL